jgi:Haem-binding domain
MIRKILVWLLVVLVIMQFFRPKKNINSSVPANNIATIYATPEDVKYLLEVGCNDCHSNNTKYPWYAEVQPVALWLRNHINEGKEEINFDEFTTYNLRRQYRKTEEIIKQVKEGEMPLNSYTWVHKNAVFNSGQKQKLVAWAENIRTQMEHTYPKESLIRKK